MVVAAVGGKAGDVTACQVEVAVNVWTAATEYRRVGRHDHATSLLAAVLNHTIRK